MTSLTLTRTNLNAPILHRLLIFLSQKDKAPLPSYLQNNYAKLSERNKTRLAIFGKYTQLDTESRNLSDDLVYFWRQFSVCASLDDLTIFEAAIKEDEGSYEGGGRACNRL